jgi:hypothetical protein
MSRNNSTNQYQNKKDMSSQRVRKATFALGHTDDSNRGYTTASNVQKSTNSKSNTPNINTTHKQKKHKQNSSNNNTKHGNNTNITNDKSKVTSYFGASPARLNERVKNSRASQLKNQKGNTVRKGSSSEITFNHKYRYDVSITLHSTTIDARLIELQQNIDALMAIIIEEDEHAKLLPWKKSKQAKHPAITSSEDTTGSFADIYLSRSWLGNMEAKHRLYMKLHIGHNKSYSNHILPALEDWNSHSDQQFKYCMLQAEETTFIGWFLYSTLSIDAGALSDAIYDEYKIEVGLRWMDIRMSTQGKKSNKAKPVKAIHVETEKSKGRSIMETLMKCYGRSFATTRNFPNGIRLRFCKNLDNAAYKLEKTKLINLRSRQNQLLAETNKTSTAGILDLDVVLKEEIEVNEETSVTTTTRTTMRDAIMAIQSKYVKETPLFRSVDLSYNSEEYVFAYHQSMADEAKAMVDYLYPYLLHIYDKKALKKGFDSVYIQEMSSFQYNMITDEVEDIIAESSYAMMKDDKITGAQNFMEFDLSAMSLEEDTNRPQASILGKMYSGQDSISTQHHAGRSRIPQATSEEILELTPDELQELQQAMLLHTQTKNKLSERKSVLHIANMDTNTMLKQIRARKEAKNKLSNNQDNDEHTDKSQSSDEEQEDSGQDNNVQDDNDDEQYQDCEDKQVESFGDEEMAEDSSDDDIDSSRGGNSIEEDSQSSKEEATDHIQISQSAMIGEEPPTPMREGGRG